MRFTEAMRRKVVSLSSAETIGLIDEFIVDPASRRVVALGLTKTSGGDTLRWDSIESFGSDAVTVSDQDKVGTVDAETAALAGKSHEFIGKRALATIGDEIGRVEDVEFDPDSGALVSIVLSGREVDAATLIGVGSYAVVLRDE